MANEYHISVGDKRPSTVQVGSIERNTGFSVVKERGETLAKRGECGFPNGAKVWAARVIDGKIPTDNKSAKITVEVTDPRYKGELKGLKWGAPGGSIISVRYIKGYPSLDVIYQEKVLNFKIDETNESSSEYYMITLPNGDNDIDENIDPLLVQHLKWHPYNASSESKDPQFFTSMFFEKTFEQEASISSKILDEKFEAGVIVRKAGENIEKCKILFSIVRSITDEQPEDNHVYSYLKMIADAKPEQFIKAVQDYKKNVSNTFEMLKSYEAIDLTKDGTIVAGDKKKEIIATDLPAKGNVMLEYLLENFTDPQAYDATFKLIQITDKIK